MDRLVRDLRCKTVSEFGENERERNEIKIIPKFLTYDRMVPFTKRSNSGRNQVYVNKYYWMSTTDQALRLPIRDKYIDESHTMG